MNDSGDGATLQLLIGFNVCYKGILNGAVHAELCDSPPHFFPECTFYKWCKKKHMHLVQLWRRIDKDGDMVVTKTQFVKALQSLCYDANLHELWSQIDSDTIGILFFLWSLRRTLPCTL